ncbi:TIGR02253 family HAD-type hydrolase [Methanothermococcus okinawensis]|uniref:Glyceraldehyde 3-phosphate phosphatase n=1 Tax=Methanothermococcus okinawensis (strain DSM 14208 / JCM 11175 / IH1) TaxID=647113 RepID=F8AM44_METOI|nr:TIGR02253 family HAD-type hydrolase [Methanothermococcus okinawensis]AEH06729.1 HAD superfamily (subfamily IA) hydrolase, TIGR02253 [Methanothermococcus okinawensis IH1]
MIKGVLFDLDDTLYDSSSFADRARREAIKMMIDAGLKATEEEAYNVLQRIIKQKGSNYNKHFDDLVKAIMGHYEPKIITMGIITYHNVKFALLRPYPDTIKTLIALKKMGLKLGVITDGITIKQWEKLIRLGIVDFFDEVITSEEFGLGKPNKEFFEYGIKKMDLNPDEAVYVGDRVDKDIIPANDVGMHAVRILKGKYKNLDGNCAYEVNNLFEVVDIIKKLKKS